MLGEHLTVSSYVVIKEGCPINISDKGGEQVEITCGTVPVNAFEFVMEREALRTFVQQGSAALADMDRKKNHDDD